MSAGAPQPELMLKASNSSAHGFVMAESLVCAPPPTALQALRRPGCTSSTCEIPGPAETPCWGSICGTNEQSCKYYVAKHSTRTEGTKRTKDGFCTPTGSSPAGPGREPHNDVTFITIVIGAEQIPVKHMSEETTVLAGAGSLGSRGSVPAQAPGPALIRPGPFPNVAEDPGVPKSG